MVDLATLGWHSCKTEAPPWRGTWAPPFATAPCLACTPSLSSEKSEPVASCEAPQWPRPCLRAPHYAPPTESFCLRSPSAPPPRPWKAAPTRDRPVISTESHRQHWAHYPHLWTRNVRSRKDEARSRSRTDVDPEPTPHTTDEARGWGLTQRLGPWGPRGDHLQREERWSAARGCPEPPRPPRSAQLKPRFKPRRRQMRGAGSADSFQDAGPDPTAPNPPV